MSLEAESGSADDAPEDLGLWDETDAPELDEIAEDLSPDPLPEDDEKPSLEATGEPDDKKEEESPEQPTQDDEKKEASEEQPKEDEPKDEEPTEDAGQAEPVLEFMGEKYLTTEEATAGLTAFEEKANSWEGRITKVQSELEDYVERDRAATNWMQDAYRENQRLVARVNELEGASDSGAAKVEGVDPPSGKLSEVLDEGTLKDLIDYAESKGANVNEVIAKYTTQKMGEAVEARFAERDAKDAAREDARASVELEDRAQQELFAWGSGVQNEDGSLAYPELNSKSEQYSEDFVRDTFSAWHDLLKESPEFAYSARGLKYAIRETRDNARKTSEGDRETPQDAPTDNESKDRGAALTESVQERKRTTRKANVETASSSNNRTSASPVTKGKRKDEANIFEAMAKAAAPVIVDGEDLGFDAV